MLYANDIFTLNVRRVRLLATALESDRAWFISMEPGNVWPEVTTLSSIADLDAIPPEKLEARRVTAAMRAVRDSRWKRISALVGPEKPNLDIFDPHLRGPMVAARAAKLGCSQRSLCKDLRQYWTGGQTRAALLPQLDRCGRTGMHITAGRGAKPKGDYKVFPLTSDDIQNFKHFIEKVYLKDRRVSITAAFDKMLAACYVSVDGNNEPCLKSIGARPSDRQFRHYLNVNYTKEYQKRCRLGDKEYERELAAKLGTALADCLGVGHYFEIDATIIDLWAVLEVDVRRIVGKPTLFLIVDRASGLIVGFYLGLENPSWAGARQAIYSMAGDWAALCASYGVKYNPEDWPAAGVFPKQFLADRGEMLTKASNYVADDLHIGVANLPSQAPQKKPLVECSFKLIHQTIQADAPAYDPPKEAHRRCGKHYEQDAVLTVREVGRVILLAIIAQNRKPRRSTEGLNLRQLAKGILPSPIALWNDGIVSRSGLLTRFSEEHVRTALLTKEVANVAGEGITFRNLYYTCPEGVAKDWFARARRGGFPVTVSFDLRLVDTILVHDPDGSGELFRATLTSRSEKYRGLCFSEVKYYSKLEAALQTPIANARAEAMFGFRKNIAPTITTATARYEAVKTSTSRKARRADTVNDRQTERAAERQRLASAPRPDVTAPPADVVELHAKKVKDGTNGPSLKQLMQTQRERLLNG